MKNEILEELWKVKDELGEKYGTVDALANAMKTKEISMNIPAKYILPDFLQGVISLNVYKNWLDHRADELFMRDRKRKCPYALNGSKRLYKEAIHQAVLRHGRTDPFTGDVLRWNLIGKWVNSGKDLAGMSDEQRREFALLPVIDHVDPYSGELELEICSWRINYCKSSLTPAEFVDLCGQVVDYCEAHGPARAVTRAGPWPVKVPAKYFLPDFLQGRCTLARYKKWLYVRARELLKKDIVRKKPYAANCTVPMYKGLIHAAVNRNGWIDPFTGRSLAWELIGTWDPFSPMVHDKETMEKYALLPTVDHIDPASEMPEFEICSFEINKCKSDLDPKEFVELCKRIKDFNS